MNQFETLYEVIQDRRRNPREGSYTNYLFEKGTDKILKKIGEESAEVIIAAKNAACGSGEKAELILELCDLAFHAAVLMAQLGIEPGEISRELALRSQKTGNLKQTHQVDKNS
ncbi:MAG: phosphoribosyl-ATP diphosphatase [Oscillospiraceae bacterium]|nr:phosphoribosyl-ATP diphosphatase [Oscillospiraceae bacterium]